MMRLCLIVVPAVVLAAACSTQVTVTPSEPDAAAPSSDAGVIDAQADAQDAQADAPSGPVLFECGADAGIPVPDGGCAEIAPGSFGACEAHVGVVYYDNECRNTNGCTGPNPPGTFVSMTECQLACGAAGKCNTTKLQKFYLDQPLEGQFCDDVEVLGVFMVSSPPAWLCAIAPDLRCEGVADGSLRCRVPTGFLSAEDVAKLCALSLVQEVEALRCWVYL